jgi:hypothetical protein
VEARGGRVLRMVMQVSGHDEGYWNWVEERGGDGVMLWGLGSKYGNRNHGASLRIVIGTTIISNA